MKDDMFKYQSKKAMWLRESHIKLGLVLVTAMLAFLKLIGGIHLDWLWVVSPLWIPIAVIAILVVLILGIFIFIICMWILINLLKKWFYVS